MDTKRIRNGINSMIYRINSALLPSPSPTLLSLDQFVICVQKKNGGSCLLACAGFSY